MPTRPTWSGSIQISLVSIAVKILPATNPGKQVEFHQIDRKMHKRVHHQNVDEAGEVEKAARSASRWIFLTPSIFPTKTRSRSRFGHMTIGDVYCFQRIRIANAA